MSVKKPSAKPVKAKKTVSAKAARPAPKVAAKEKAAPRKVATAAKPAAARPAAASLWPRPARGDGGRRAPSKIVRAARPNRLPKRRAPRSPISK